MKIRIGRSRLLEGLKKVQSAANAKNAMPILGNVKVDATGKRISLTATDLDITLYTEVDGQIDEPGATTVNVKLFSNIIAKQMDGEIEIFTEGTRVYIRRGSYDGNVATLPADQFPKQPTDEAKSSFTVKTSVFVDMIKKTSYAQSTDDTRLALKSTLVEAKDGKISCVATDGRRLALTENDAEGLANEERFILPARSVSILKSFSEGGETMTISVMKTQISFSLDDGNSVMYSRIIDSEYPNYKQVIPSGETANAVIDRDILIDAINRVASNDETGGVSVKLTFDGGMLTIENRTDAESEAKDCVPIKYNGERITAIFNPKYLTDPLNAANSDTIVFKLTSGKAPAVIQSEGEEFFCVLMPMREH